jgi:uncharacterized protein YbjT (DUF2867 family)
MILITAATGQIGRAATRTLVASGARVRALVRDPSRAAGLDGAELVKGSFENEASLARALDGVQSVLLAGRDNPGYVAQLERIVAAAASAHVEHVVALSAIGAAASSPTALMRDHHEVEQLVKQRATSWTFLRPHLYMQNLLRAADDVRLDGRLSAPMGGLAFPFVATDDVGAVAATVLVDPGPHAGMTYALTGPVAQTYESIADALTRLLERPVSYDAIAPEQYLADLVAGGIPEWRAHDLAFIASAYAPADRTVIRDLPALLGRPAQSLRGFLEAHRDAFLGLRP